MLKGGHEAPTKPKGRPKKNSIPTTEEIEAEERLAAQQERLLAEGQGEVFQSQPQDLSTSATPTVCSSGPETQDLKMASPSLSEAMTTS